MQMQTQRRSLACLPATLAPTATNPNLSRVRPCVRYRMLRYQCRWRGSRNKTRRWRVPRTTTAAAASTTARPLAPHTMWVPDWWATDWLKWLSGLQCGALNVERMWRNPRAAVLCVGCWWFCRGFLRAAADGPLRLPPPPPPRSSSCCGRRCCCK